MKVVLKGKWFVIIAWIAVIAILIMSAPNMENLVREKGQTNVPDGYPSTIAAKILNEVQSKETTGKGEQTALVFHSNTKLTKADFTEAEQAVSRLESQKNKLGIISVTSPFDQPELKDQLESKDGKTILVSLEVEANGRQAKDVANDLYNAIKGTSLQHYYTGSWMIDDDLVTNSQQGLKKTEGITVVFILAVLLLVFRSLIAPVIPLITVGISYISAQSIVAILADKVNFPISNFTQIFLVAVLFGIGTDYCILLLSRYKEELSRRKSVYEAVIETYRTAGKTVLFSGVAVMIGFASIGFSTFKLYQSASAVAIGVAILLLALMTIVPFFMAIFGRKIFWPTKGNLEHGESKIWGFAGRFAIARPLIAFLIVALVSVPFLFIYKGTLSYNSLEEIGNGFNSVKGFNIISDSFGPGETMPTQIVIKNDVNMDSPDYISIAEKISQDLSKVSDVKTVRSVSRPTGSPIDSLYISNQAKTLGDGIGKGNDGIEKISSGLKNAGSQLSASQPKMKQTTDGISSLIQGTNQLKTGIVPITNGLAQIESGMKQGSAGSSQLKSGMEQIKASSEVLLTHYKQLLQVYKQEQAGLQELQSNYQQIINKISTLQSSLEAGSKYFSQFEKAYPAIKQNQSYLSIKNSYQGALALGSSLIQMNSALISAEKGMAAANTNFAKVIAMQEQQIGYLEQLIQGIDQQKAGLDALASGQQKIINNLPQVSNGLTGLNSGHQQLLNGFKDLGGQMNQLTSGLSQSAEGLQQVSTGLTSAQGYLSGVAEQPQNGFYIPQNVLDSKDFAKVLNTYMSSDRKEMTIDVIFSKNPYSNEAISRIPELNQVVARAVKNTMLENAQIAIGGVTSTYHDLNTISEHDYSRTVVFMLIGIGIILVLLLRSIVMPLYLIGSLVLTYYTAMAISETIFVDGLGYTGISWAVPFFAFVILIALGIDYSIFLMDRFNEFRNLSVEEAILSSMKKMGTVIISAAIILGGTFSAMMPAGVLSLLEIATIILIGLILYALFILPLLVPVMVKTFGIANWWPFVQVSSAETETEQRNISG